MTDQGVIDSFINGVEQLFAHTDQGEDGFGTEFLKIKQLSATIKQNPQFLSSEGEKVDNKKKNRYKDILPFDYARVKLSSNDDNSDYINASFINGPDHNCSYIASQGPLPHTVSDFWRMLWEYKVKVMIMVCREVENGKQKCERYWSTGNKDVKVFGDITVTAENIEIYDDDSCQRTLSVKRAGETRTIRQLHYRGWPDHGVPRTRDAILKIVEIARSLQDYRADSKSPLCVHCSAGCGRTGVVIVIDYFRHLLKTEGFTSNLRVFDVVSAMRKQRPAIVQTRDQYEFVHLAISEMCTKHMQSRGKALTSNLSKSLTSTTYENVTFSEKPRAKPKPNKVANFNKKHLDGSYENLVPHESANHSTKQTFSSGHHQDHPEPHRPGLHSEPLDQRSPISKVSPKPRTDLNQVKPKMIKQPVTPSPTNKPPVLPQTKPRFAQPNPRSDANSVNAAVAETSALLKTDVVVTESLQARKERLLFLGLSPSDDVPKKSPGSVLDLKSINNAPVKLNKPKLQRTSSMDNSARLNNSNNINEDKFRDIEPNGKSALTPPTLPRKSNSIKVYSHRSEAQKTAGKNPNFVPDILNSEKYAPVDHAKNYSHIGKPNKPKRSSGYDNLVRSVKYKDNERRKSDSYDRRDNPAEETSLNAKQTVDNILYQPDTPNSKIAKPKSKPRVHVYTEVDEFPGRNKDFDKILPNSKPPPAVKPKIEEASPGDVYAMADNFSNVTDVYAQTNKPSEPVYSTVSGEKTEPVYAFSTDPTPEIDDYANLSGEKINTGCPAARPRSSSNASSRSNSRLSGGGAVTTPPIPERTPDSRVLLPADRSVANNRASDQATYECPDFDNSRRPSATPSGKPNPAQARTHNVFGKAKHAFAATFQLGGGSNKSDDSQHQRAKPTNNVNEPVLIGQQDISFGNRLKGKPKGGRPPPSRWKNKLNFGKH